jgi:hypothetical protein
MTDKNTAYGWNVWLEPSLGHFGSIVGRFGCALKHKLAVTASLCFLPAAGTEADGTTTAAFRSN